MKRIASVLLIIAMISLLTACIPVSSAEEKTETTANKPKVITTSSEWIGSSRGKYVATAETGLICSGRAYCEKKNAIANPLEIQANGYEIKVTLVDTESAVEAVLKAGEDKLLVCDSGSFNGYIYVIVT